MIDTSTGPVLNAASGAVLAVIGFWVWSKSPRAPANATFGVFAAVFAIVGLAASEFLVDEYGYLAGAVAAGLLLFALEPLKRLGASVAERALPHVHDDATYRAGRSLDIYRAAVQGMMADGVLNDKEQDVLAKLADDLGLAVQEVRAIEKELI